MVVEEDADTSEHTRTAVPAVRHNRMDHFLIQGQHRRTEVTTAAAVNDPVTFRLAMSS